MNMAEFEKRLPHGASNPRIVLGYDGQVKLMVDAKDNYKNWTSEDFTRLAELKVEYLELVLGYKIQRLGLVVSHDDHEMSK